MTPSLASFYTTGGTLSRGAPSYVERQADHQLREGLREGEFCYVLTSRQMGKSSLMVRTASTLRENGIRTIALDLTAVGQIVTPEQWYDGLLGLAARQLRLEDLVDDFWLGNERLGPCQRFFAAIRDAILVQQPGPLVVFVDEIDTVRSLPFSTDEFFAAIRECYNRRVNDPELRRLTFCLLGVATPSDLIRDTRTTPFNIGRRIELHDFTEEEAEPLARGMRHPPSREMPTDAEANGHPGGLRLAKRLLSRILYWTGGHPYLTQRFCRAVAENPGIRTPAGVDRVCDELFFSNRAKERDDNLLFVRERLLRGELDKPGLLELYRNVRRGEVVPDDETSQPVGVLRLSGIVKVEEGRLAPRNRIYSRVFDPTWVDAQMPDADRRRIRAAFYRGVIRTSAVAALVVVALTVAVVIAVQKADQARKVLGISRFSQARAERMSGRSGTRVTSLQALEKACLSYPNKLELRNEAIASLALLDLEPTQPAVIPPSGGSALALNHGLTHYAAGNSSGAILLIDTESHEPTARFPSIEIPISWLAVSPNGRYVAAQYDEPGQHRLLVWESASGQYVLDFTNQVLQTALDFSGDSSTLAVGLPEGRIEIFSLPQKRIASWTLSNAIGEPRVPWCVRLDHRGHHLAESSRSSQTVWIWNVGVSPSDIPSDLPVTNLFHSDLVIAMAWSADGHYMATASENGGLFLWDLRQPDKKRAFVISHSEPVIDVAFSPSGDLLASVGADRALKLWRTGTDRALTYQVESESSGRLQFSRDGQRLGYASQKAGIRRWDILGLEHYRVFGAFPERNAPFTSLSIGPEGRVVAAANQRSIVLWDAATGGELCLLPMPARPTKSALLHWGTGDLLASTSSGFYRWTRQTNADVDGLTLTFAASQCFDLPAQLGRFAMDPTGARAAVVHQAHIHLVDIASSSDNRILAPRGRFDALSLSPDGKWLVTWTNGSPDVEVWAIDNGDEKPFKTLPGLRHFAFSPDGQFLVTCSAGQYRLWDTASWLDAGVAMPRSQSGDGHCVMAVARAWTGATLLAVADSPTTIKLFQLTAGPPASLLELAMLESPDPRSPAALAFSDDGSRLAMAAADQTVQVWDLARIREDLARMNLAGDLPQFPSRSERSLRVVSELDTPDVETPHRWHKVESLTDELARAQLENRSQLLIQRGKLHLQLRRPMKAKLDFEAALLPDPTDPEILELLEQAKDALKRQAKPRVKGKPRQPSPTGKQGHLVPRPHL